MITAEIRIVKQWQSTVPEIPGKMKAQNGGAVKYFPGLFANKCSDRPTYIMPAMPHLTNYDMENGTYGWENPGNLYDTPEEAQEAWDKGTPVEMEPGLGARNYLSDEHISYINEQGLYRTGLRPPIINMKTVEPIAF